jgi:hypothetical protein
MRIATIPAAIALVVIASRAAAQSTEARDTSAPSAGSPFQPTDPNAPAGPPSTEGRLPPIPADAQRVVDQWRQDLASVVEQLRIMQQSYRDSGHAEEAAAIALQVRALRPQSQSSNSTAVADLVNEGLADRDMPIVMSRFRDHVGEALTFVVRGRDDQPVWGTTIYTDDSALETAAVHAGLLRAGQTAIVKVGPAPGQPRYEASVQNGVQSLAFAEHAGSYRFVSASISRPTRTTAMTSYRDLVGHSITLPVVGVVSNNVWGSDVYTDDSLPAAAAVHAGVLAPGEFGFVKVTLMPGQAQYESSARNGITSRSFAAWEGSFRIERASEPWTVQLPFGEDSSRLVDLAVLRGRPGTSFDVQVVGATAGSLWGTDAYTDDSSIAVAAVHAGLLKRGEAGLVHVVIGRGRESYAGSERNGVRSQPYGKYEGTFIVERVPK